MVRTTVERSGASSPMSTAASASDANQISRTEPSVHCGPARSGRSTSQTASCASAPTASTTSRPPPDAFTPLRLEKEAPASGREAGTAGEVGMVLDVGEPAVRADQCRQRAALLVGVLDAELPARLQQPGGGDEQAPHDIQPVGSAPQRQ